MKFKNRLFTVRKLLTQFCKNHFLSTNSVPGTLLGSMLVALRLYLGIDQRTQQANIPAPVVLIFFLVSLPGSMQKDKLTFIPTEAGDLPQKLVNARAGRHSRLAR